MELNKCQIQDVIQEFRVLKFMILMHRRAENSDGRMRLAVLWVIVSLAVTVLSEWFLPSKKMQ